MSDRGNIVENSRPEEGGQREWLRAAAPAMARFLLGFLLAAYLNVPVLGIALLGVIIVALMLVNDQNKPNNTAVVDGGADDDF